jgi:PAS domain S-box-containing protein
MCVADPISRRLIEGVSVQLELTPIFFEESELTATEHLEDVEILLADEPVARRFAEMFGHYEYRSDGLNIALVAIVPALSPEGVLLPKREAQQPFDGLVELPQSPTHVLAQLSVILYAHRAYTLRYESALEELNLNRRIFQSVTSGISVSDALAPDFPLVYVNPAFEVMTGYSLEEVEGRNCRFLQGQDRDQPGIELVREALAEKREAVVVMRNYRKDGTAFWNELSLSPIRDANGVVTHFVGIQNDVTARIAFEDALRESEKLAAVGRLAASIAHEINNPLTSVTNLLYLARREQENDVRDGFLKTAEQELYRVSQLTTQSLRFYKQSTKPQAIRASELVTAVLDVYSPKISKLNIQLDRRDRKSAAVMCLESEIRQVISNLVRNAMDAMWDTGGRLLVRSREATDWHTGNKGVAITVADTGTGMAAETVSKLYTAFFTTKGLGGTGLGLWVSSGVVQRHRGRLTVRSRQGEKCGTVFKLFLPFEAVS